ncbi:putative stress response protein, TerZ- and CABP1 [Frankia torreyi]|uniref:Putative stress response protein, TerZ-and CABP1 n=1 Tax=Frankia torreyi TaxID=1856 RepID=A0A0D8B8V4_9ACTN|nr:MULTISPECIES: TerD family protein [Frankia]KJE20636.1 putative stress response protein, TerZ- and CABP1 [Frankia torreyi]KQC35096.1 chemical-damaging agent resistance protein C [Frankia sp. ACN1ag]KQM03082.1 putative stress response protein, TerZ- and CABP1 [Frankia sp. CpI1-P]
MGIDLAKGGSVALTEATETLTHITVGLGWDPNRPGAEEFDLDASAIALQENDRAPSLSYFVYYNNLSSPRGEIVHRGDNLTGEGAGDDEQIDVRLDLLSSAITRIVFPVSIHNADYRHQSFGDVHGAYIRVVSTDTGDELVRYDLSSTAARDTSMLFGELHRDGGGWHFRALGEGGVAGLAEIARGYGLDV